MVTLGVNDALPPTTVLTNTYQNMTFANFSQLILNGYTQTLAGIFSVANTNTLVTNRITGGSTNSSMLTVSNAVAYTYNGILGGTNANDNNLALVKAGTNTLTLTRANTYTNWTTISNGTLLVNGSLASKEVTVATGATLGGTGTVSGTIKVSGIISSGSGGSGQLNAGNVTWSSGTTASSNTDWVFKLASGQTNLHMTGQFTKGNGSVFRFDFAGSTSTGTFVLADGIIITNFNATDFSYVNLGPGGGGRAATFQITDSSTKLQVTVVKTNFSVEAYGAITNDPGDAAPAIRRAIQAAIADGPGSVVSFQPGMYRISLDTNTGYCLNMAYANGLSLQGSNTTLIVTDPLTGGLRWLYGTNCSVSGITLDYAPLHFTQGTITNINPNAGTFDVIVDADYPLPDEVRFTNQWGMIMDQTKSQPTQKAGTVDQVRMSSSPTNVSGRTYRFTPENTNVVRLQIAVSNRFVYIAQYFRNGFYFQTCTNFLVANVTVNAAPGASISQLGGEGMQVRNCSISVPAGSGRLLAAGGGIGCKWARKGPVIADNYFEATHDDIVDILSTPTPILQVASSTSITVEAAASLVPILSGDRIQVLDPVNGSFRGEATATNVVLVGGTNYQLTLDVPISGMTNGTGLSNSDSLYNLSASGKDYVISNNVINPHRARGLLLHSSGIVISNRITGASMSGILVDNESGPAWWEGPVASGITIRSNIIDGCGYADPYSDGSIRIASFRSGTSGKFVDAKGICVRDIIIQDNIITNWATVAIHASSVSNLSLINNQIQSSDTVNSYIDDIQGMVFENARAIVLSGGTIIDPRTNLHAGIHVLNTVWQSTNGFRTNNFVTNSAPFFSLATNIVPNIPNILDDRNTNSPLFVFVVTPSIAPIPTQTIMSGSNLVLSITATPQPLNFNLFSAPTGAVIDKVSGVFTWRPTLSQSGTNQVVV
ncbi:MAG: autotransporter-associated beta strand repeat-containing protein, partial [Verrucomicrobia bacterium]|nr:autotransporter-associated beta strand repeat-containing protein [Verrucomicrobiota bacterium]